jgi:hypothetical protein
MNVFEGARRVTHVVAGLTAAFWLWSAYENWSDAQSSRAKVERLIRSPVTAEALESAKRGEILTPRVQATFDDARRRGVVPAVPAHPDWKVYRVTKEATGHVLRFDLPGGASHAEIGEKAALLYDAWREVEDASSAEADARERAKQRLSPLGWGPWLAGLYGVSWVIGWVVRGFMGIPRGSDRKPKPPEALMSEVFARAKALRDDGADPTEAAVTAALDVLDPKGR